MTSRDIAVATVLAVGVAAVVVGLQGAFGRENGNKAVASTGGSAGVGGDGAAGTVGKMSPATAAGAGGKGDAKARPAADGNQKNRSAKPKTTPLHPDRPKAVDPPVAPTADRSRYHCNHTYCNDESICFSPSPPNCTP